jgi:hypothetical protein
MCCVCVSFVEENESIQISPCSFLVLDDETDDESQNAFFHHDDASTRARGKSEPTSDGRSAERFCFLAVVSLVINITFPAVSYSTMVATAGIALACLLTSQDHRHGIDYASRNRPPTAFFSGFQSAPFEFEFDPRRNRNVNKHSSSSSTRLFAKLEVKVLEQDGVGTMSKEVDHSPLGLSEVSTVDSLRSQDKGKDLLQEALLADECWTPAADDDGLGPQQTDDRHEEALVALNDYFLPLAKAGNFDRSGKTNF